MKVSDLFYILSVGELSNLAMGSEGSGVIRDQDQGKLITYTNAAMNELYKRFVVRTSEVLIETVDYITTYHFDKRYALSSHSTEPVKYIIDTSGNPFRQDVIRILEVWDSLRNQFPMNDPGNSRSLFTPYPNVLQVPNPINGDGLSVIYQATAIPLEFRGMTSENVLEQTIDIPAFLESPLINHIAYKVFSHLNGQEHQAKAQEYLTLYEDGCSKIEESDLVSQTQSTSHTKLTQRGFV